MMRDKYLPNNDKCMSNLCFAFTQKSSNIIYYNLVWSMYKCTRVEAPITDHLLDSAPNPQKYQVVQQEDRNQEDCEKIGNFIPQIEMIVNFEAKSWPKHITNVQSL